MMPCDIGTSSVSGELVLTIVNTLGSPSSCVVRAAAGDAHHLDQSRLRCRPSEYTWQPLSVRVRMS